MHYFYNKVTYHAKNVHILYGRESVLKKRKVVKRQDAKQDALTYETTAIS
jgi:hypothetical protein